MKNLLKIIGFSAAFLICAAAGAYLTLTWIIKSEDTVIVPDLVGKDVVDVLKILSDLELHPNVTGSEFNRDVPENHTLFQEPGPGREIKKGRSIDMIISKGPETVAVPDLKGLSRDGAISKIKQNRLHSGVISTTYHDDAPKGSVLCQYPFARTMITRDRVVDLLISAGRPETWYAVPLLKGMPLNEAVVLIEKNNLTLGKVTTVYQKNLPDNTVFRQRPKSGYPAPAGAEIDLVRSRTPDKRNSRPDSAVTGVYLFRYAVKNGFLKKRIRIGLRCFGLETDLFNDYMKPGEETWALIPKNNNAAVSVFEDDQLVTTRQID